MLCLSRRESEDIVLYVPGMAEPIVVRVVRAMGVVRLGIEAPKSVSIVRREIDDRRTQPLPAEAALSLDDDTE